MTHYEYRMIVGIAWTAASAVGTLVTELWLASEEERRGNVDDANKHAQNATSALQAINERASHYTRAGED